MENLTIYRKIIPEKSAEYADFPVSLRRELGEYLNSRNIPRLYTHQAEMYEAAMDGANVVITTSTASGKTLSFLLPVVQRILEDPLTRAIFLYPTKALASDQYRAIAPILEYFGPGRISAGVYDGDTAPAERSRIRKSANIILTNPEMLNSAFLPNHSKFGFDFIFSNLKYIVIDELHSYRGAFGAHLANLFRRMKRICNYYQSAPQFLCSSATIANPIELAELICKTSFVLIDRDGSPAPEKEYRIIQPPQIKGSHDKIYGRKSASSIASEVICRLVENEAHFIAFAKSRRNVEVILKESRDKLDGAAFLGCGGSGRIAGYRGGYTPLERKEIERKMLDGDLLGLVSTNALELGIDIGKLDSTLLAGYPGTRASFWQQTGRAGRNGEKCINYLILANQPFDQYIAIDPEWLFSMESENAVVDPDNLLIELSHVRAAAAEMPLTMDDVGLFPDLGEIIPVLLNAEEVKGMSGRFAWAGPAFPAGDYSLRNMDQTRFKLILDESLELPEENGREKFAPRVITEMDENQAYHELHPGAVYMHEGTLYEVLKLDLVSRTAWAVPFSGNYYTVPAGNKDTKILQVFEETEFGRTQVHFGDINMNEMIYMFKKLQFHNHQNLGYVQLPEALQKDYDTESTWIDIPQNVTEMYHSLLLPNAAGELALNNHFEGVCHAIKNAAMMVTMTAGDDIDAVICGDVVLKADSGNAGNQTGRHTPDSTVSQGISESDSAVFQGISESDPAVFQRISESDPAVSQGISESDPAVSQKMPLSDPAISQGISESDPTASQEMSAFNSAVSLDSSGFRQQVSLYIYDRYEGGLGYSEKIYELVPQIIDNAVRMVGGCGCENGCPACVGDYSLDKGMVLWGLQNLKEKSEPPQYKGKYTEKERPAVRKEYSFLKLPKQWSEFCENAVQRGEGGAAFLQSVKAVEVSGHRLVLTVENAFYEAWLGEPENMRIVEKILQRHVECPLDMKVETIVKGNTEESIKKKEKLRRRYENRF